MSLFKVEDYKVDIESNCVSNEQSTIDLEPKATQLLAFFLKHPNKTLTRELIIKEVWHGTQVSHHAINRVVAQLRKAFNDSIEKPRFIKTISKQGYQFIATVENVKRPDIIDNNKTLNDKKYSKFTLLSLLLSTIIFVVIIFYFDLFQKKIIDKSTELGLAADKYFDIHSLTSLPGKEGDPVFSADGQSLAFIHRSNETAIYQIYIKDIANNRVKKVTDWPGNSWSLAWSNDNKTLAYLLDLPSGECAIMAYKLSTGVSRKIYDCGTQQISSISWGRTLNELLITLYNDENSNTDIYQYNMISKKLEILPITGQVKFIDYWPKLSQDKNQMVFLRYNNSSQTSIMHYDFTTFITRELQKSDGIFYRIDWHKANESIIFTINNKLFEKVITEINSVHKKNIKPIYTATNPIHSAVSNLITGDIAFVSNIQNDVVRTINANQKDTNAGRSNKVLVNSFSFNQVPVYSSTGKKIAFISNRSGTYQVWLYEKNKEVLQLTRNAKNIINSSFAWSEDDREFFYIDDGEVVSIDLKNKEIKKYEMDKKNVQNVYPSWDKNYFFYTVLNSIQIELWSFNVVNNSSTKLTTLDDSHIRVDFKTRSILYLAESRKEFMRLSFDQGVMSKRILYTNSARSGIFAMAIF